MPYSLKSEYSYCIITTIILCPVASQLLSIRFIYTRIHIYSTTLCLMTHCQDQTNSNYKYMTDGICNLLAHFYTMWCMQYGIPGILKGGHFGCNKKGFCLILNLIAKFTARIDHSIFIPIRFFCFQENKPFKHFSLYMLTIETQ